MVICKGVKGKGLVLLIISNGDFLVRTSFGVLDNLTIHVIFGTWFIVRTYRESFPESDR